MPRVRPVRLAVGTSTKLLFGLAVLSGLIGCAPKSYIVLLPSPDGSVGQVIIKGQKGEHVLSAAGQAGTLDGEAIKGRIDDAQLNRDFANTMAAQPMPPSRYLLYFTAGTNLTTESKALIRKIVADAAMRPAVDVSVIGHTDTVHTTTYNDYLALNRANKVSELLQENGLKANSLSIESHGKRNLLILTPDDVREPRNRRVEVSLR